MTFLSGLLLGSLCKKREVLENVCSSGKVKGKGVLMSSNLASNEINPKHILCSPWMICTEYFCSPKIYAEILTHKVIELEIEAFGK